MVRLFAFNLLVAGVDAHAKNHSLLLAGPQARLAPASDLISAFGVWDEDHVRFRSSAAVKHGRERRYRSITGRNLARTADVLDTPRTDFVDLLRTMATQLPDAIESAVAELPDVLRTERVERMPQTVGSFATDLADRTSPEDVRDTGAWVAARVVEPTPPGVWMTGHWVGDSWQLGRRRTRT